jgi:endogenous inhibitor of DNA gyrase (YacG/DUF329 family)
LAKQDEEEVACPVCGKPVGLSVPSCPYCGAEFEEEEEVEEEAPVVKEIPKGKAKGKAKAAPPPVVAAEEVEEVSCPVCGKPVGLEVASCPHCGAEFEETEVEEVIEVEEKQVVEKEEPEEEVAEVAAEEAEEVEAPTSIMDLRVIGVALIILGIIGSQVALMINWYWSWVPPISHNLGLFVAIPVVVLVVGLLVFMLVKKAVSGGRTVPGMMSGVALSLFLFGILALIVVLLFDPINKALESSQMSVGLGFILVLVAGLGLMFMGMRTAASRAAS